MNIKTSTQEKDPEFSNGEGQEVSASENFQKVQDLLFGKQFRGLQAELENLRAFVETSFARNRSEFESRIQTLESNFKFEISSLADKLYDEEQQRLSGESDTRSSLENVEKYFNESIGSLQENFKKDNSNIRNDLASATSMLGGQLRAAKVEISQKLSSSVSELENDKASRTFVAELLSDVANRLNDGK